MNDTDIEVLRRSVRRWRATAGVAVLALAPVAVWSTYAAVDAAVSLSYARAGEEQRQRSTTLLERLALKVSQSTTRLELTRMLDQHGVAWFEKDAGLHAEDLGFYFDANDKLACITSTYPATGTPCAPFAAGVIVR